MDPEVIAKIHLPAEQASADKGPLPVMGAAPFSFPSLLNVGWYVDGFNLYHAVKALNRPALKWLDINSLAASYLKPHHRLTSVNFFTALNRWNAEKRQRHVNFVTALEHTGVKVHKAKFDKIDKYCKNEDRYCPFHVEKESDVGISVAAISDAFLHRADIFFFLTADSDQIPTFRCIKDQFPEKRVFLVAPPGRLPYARELGAHAHHVFELTAGRLAQHLLPMTVRNEKGKKIAAIPATYVSRLE